MKTDTLIEINNSRLLKHVADEIRAIPEIKPLSEEDQARKFLETVRQNLCMSLSVPVEILNECFEGSKAQATFKMAATKEALEMFPDAEIDTNKK